MVEKVHNVVMRVHTAGVTGTGRSGTLQKANSGFQLLASFRPCKEESVCCLLFSACPSVSVSVCLAEEWRARRLLTDSFTHSLIQLLLFLVFPSLPSSLAGNPRVNVFDTPTNIKFSL